MPVADSVRLRNDQDVIVKLEQINAFRPVRICPGDNFVAIDEFPSTNDTATRGICHESTVLSEVDCHCWGCIEKLPLSNQ